MVVGSTFKIKYSNYLKEDAKLVLKTSYRLMQIKSRERSALLSTSIKLSPVFNTIALSIYEWPLKTDFTVCIAYRRV